MTPTDSGGITRGMDVKLVPIGSLTPHPLNSREGDVGAITHSIEAHGVYKPLITQASTGLVIAGNQTLAAMHALGHKRVAIIEHECDDDEALAILLVDNRTSDLATMDVQKLSDVLKVLAARDALAGTGYDADDVDAIVREANSMLPPLPPDPDPRIVTCPACGHEFAP